MDGLSIKSFHLENDLPAVVFILNSYSWILDSGEKHITPPRQALHTSAPESCCGSANATHTNTLWPGA